MNHGASIRLEGVARTYPGVVPVEALKPTDLAFDPGDYVAVMGPSGSGKSTFLHVVGCLDRPTAGRYLLDGDDVARLDDAALAAVRGRTIGFVFQRFHLLRDEPAWRNVALPLLYQRVGRRERVRRADEALDRVGLLARRSHDPARLSGGEQQRVAFARALVKRPRLLLCDEPTGNLDSEAGERVLALIRDAHASGTTVLLITHDARVAAEARRGLVLRDGVFTDPGRP